MDAKYLAEIRARCELGRPAQQREVKALLAEVERLQQEIRTGQHMCAPVQLDATAAESFCNAADVSRLEQDNAVKDQQIATLKKALELICDEVADSCCPFDSTEYSCPNASTCPNATGGREDHGRDTQCWYDYFIRKAQEQEAKQK